MSSPVKDAKGTIVATYSDVLLAPIAPGERWSFAAVGSNGCYTDAVTLTIGAQVQTIAIDATWNKRACFWDYRK